MRSRRAGPVSCPRAPSTETSPPPGSVGAPSPGRRTRKAYRITEQGRGTFAELLADDNLDDDRSFALKLSFCRFLGHADRLALLERRRNQLSQRLTKARRAPSRTIDRYTRSLLEHRARSTQHDIEWIDELIAEERAE